MRSSRPYTSELYFKLGLHELRGARKKSIYVDKSGKRSANERSGFCSQLLVLEDDQMVWSAKEMILTFLRWRYLLLFSSMMRMCWREFQVL